MSGTDVTDSEGKISTTVFVKNLTIYDELKRQFQKFSTPKKFCIDQSQGGGIHGEAHTAEHGTTPG